MKKIITVVMMIATIAAFAQMETTKHKVMAGADFGYAFDSADAPWAQTSFTIPGIGYEFEAKPNDMFKLYLHGALGYYMYKETTDGEVADGEDTFGSDMYLTLDPKAKAYLPNNLFVKLALPFAYVSMTPQVEDADAVSAQGLNMEATFGFDNREIEQHMLTPWDKFEKGMAFYGVYEMGIMASYDGESIDDLPSYFGVEGCYSILKENMMIKPYLSFMMQLNEDAMDKDTEVYVGAMFAKDFSEKFNLEADLNLYINDTQYSNYDAAADEFLDREMALNISAIGNFYVMPELNIYGGLGMNMDLSYEEGVSTTGFELGAIYTMNLLK